AADGDPAGVGRVGAGEHLDQRALAGAVLAQQHVHLATAQIEVHAVERDHAGEGLADALDAQQLVRTAAAHGVLLRTGEGGFSIPGSPSPHEWRTTSRAGRVTEAPGPPSIRSTGARTAARPRSRTGWAIAVTGGCVCTNQGRSS